jgi:hypothetical protein
VVELNDPFVGALAFGFLNIIPPAILPGQGVACMETEEAAPKAMKHGGNI